MNDPIIMFQDVSVFLENFGFKLGFYVKFIMLTVTTKTFRKNVLSTDLFAIMETADAFNISIGKL